MFPYKTITSTIALTALGITALIKGIDGLALAGICTLIAGLGGFALGKFRKS